MSPEFVYLAKQGDRIIFHTDLKAMKDMDGIVFDESKGHVKVSMEEWSEAGGSTHIAANGKITLGMSPEDKLEKEKEEKLNEYKFQLDKLDKDSGASRHVRDVSISAGVVLDAVRIIISKFAKKLGVKIPENFGAGVASAEDIAALQPPAGATQEETEDFYLFKSLLLLSYFDPAINPGLTQLTKAETTAAIIRSEMSKLS